MTLLAVAAQGEHKASRFGLIAIPNYSTAAEVWRVQRRPTLFAEKQNFVLGEKAMQKEVVPCLEVVCSTWRQGCG